jgi:hypothetical protein
MPSSRFEKAANLAKQLKTWNHNDVAQVVRESLDLESKNTWGYGLSNSRQDIALETGGKFEASQEFDNPMQCFHSYVAVGLRPPAEVLICMERCIGDYIRGGGKISLDNAFFGKEHVATRSYAKLNHDNSLDSKYAFFDAIKDLSARKSIEGKAEEFLSAHLDDSLSDVQSFLKGFNRWKSSKNR